MRLADWQGAEAEAEEGRDGGWREALEILEMIVRRTCYCLGCA